MEKELDRNFATFAKPSSSAPLGIGLAVVSALLVCGMVIAAVSAHWLLFAIFLFAAAAAGVTAYFALTEIRRVSAAEDNPSFDWGAAIPEVQKQNLNVEVFELAKILEVESEQMSDLQSAYLVAEDLALRQIQQEEGIPLMRHVTLCKAPFDAVYVKDGIAVCVDVSFMVAPEIRKEKIDVMMRKAARVREGFAKLGTKTGVRLMVVLITQLTPEDEQILRKALNTDTFAGTPVDIDLRLLDFEMLQRLYVTN
jgi:hypothetical protein